MRCSYCGMRGSDAVLVLRPSCKRCGAGVAVFVQALQCWRCGLRASAADRIRAVPHELSSSGRLDATRIGGSDGRRLPGRLFKPSSPRRRGFRDFSAIPGSKRRGTGLGANDGRRIARCLLPPVAPRNRNRRHPRRAATPPRVFRRSEATRDGCSRNRAGCETAPDERRAAALTSPASPTRRTRRPRARAGTRAHPPARRRGAARSRRGRRRTARGWRPPRRARCRPGR